MKQPPDENIDSNPLENFQKKLHHIILAGTSIMWNTSHLKMSPNAKALASILNVMRMMLPNPESLSDIFCPTDLTIDKQP